MKNKGELDRATRGTIFIRAGCERLESFMIGLCLLIKIKTIRIFFICHIFILLIPYPIDSVRASFLSESLGDTNCLRKPCQHESIFKITII